MTVEADDQEMDAVLGWVTTGPCLGDGTGVVSDGFFAGLEDAVLTIDGDDALRVVAPAFDEADLEAVWNGSDTSESPAVVSKTGAGTWEISEGPRSDGTHVLNLRFEHGEDLDAAFAVTVELQG